MTESWQVCISLTSRSGSGEYGLATSGQCVYRGHKKPVVSRGSGWVEVGREPFAGIILWSRLSFPSWEWKWRVFSFSPSVSPILMAPAGPFWDWEFISPLPGGFYHFPKSWLDFLWTDTELQAVSLCWRRRSPSHPVSSTDHQMEKLLMYSLRCALLLKFIFEEKWKLICQR